jgi:hypothetical protein
MVSCIKAHEPKLVTKEYAKVDVLSPEVVVIDSCEYIQYKSGNGYRHITHKGNCKFCAERNRKLLTELFKK